MIDSLTSDPGTPNEYCATNGHAYTQDPRDRCSVCLAPFCSICDLPIDDPVEFENRHFPDIGGEAHWTCCQKRGCDHENRP